MPDFVVMIFKFHKLRLGLETILQASGFRYDPLLAPVESAFNCEHKAFTLNLEGQWVIVFDYNSIFRNLYKRAKPRVVVFQV